MATPARNSRVLHFGVFEADLQEAELRKGGIRIKLQDQPFQILRILLERPGQTVTREELRQRLWPADTFVDFDHSLNSSIKKLREALGDDSENPRFIETLHRRGYRFIQPVSGDTPPAAEHVGKPEPVAIVHTSRYNWAIVACAIAGILLVAGSKLTSPQLVPKITVFTQLTSDGQLKVGPLLSDGVRIYFGHSLPDGVYLNQVPVNGGDSVPLSTSPKKALHQVDISSDKSKLLVFGASTLEPQLPSGFPPAHTTPPCILPIAGGSLRCFGTVYPDSAAWGLDTDTVMYSKANEIFLVRIDGRGSRRLATIPGVVYLTGFSWSPNRRTVRFAVGEGRSPSSGDPLNVLWEMSADATKLRPVLPGWSNLHAACCGHWTPDGKYFVFQATSQGRTDLWVIPEVRGIFGAGGGQPVRLTHGPIQFHSPMPSADGKKIFAIGRATRVELARFDPQKGEFLPYLPGISADQLSFSSDGKWVVYVSFPEGSLWRAKVDGTDRVQLTFPPMRVIVPRWSPDGKRIAFMAAGSDNIWKIYVVPVEGGAARLLLPGSGQEADPNWSADGQWLVFGPVCCPKGSETELLHTLDMRTNHVSMVPGSRGFYSPRWSPDGRYLAALRAITYELMLFDFISKKWTQLTDFAAAYPNWSHDGRYIYFQDKTKGIDAPPRLVRISIPGRKLETLVDMARGMHVSARADVIPWSGLAPDDSPLVVRDISTEEIYALDWQEQ